MKNLEKNISNPKNNYQVLTPKPLNLYTLKPPMIIRHILLRLLGLKRYLLVISKFYIFCVNRGFWKTRYPELFFLSQIVKEGQICIDIGANLGYYTTRLADIVGKTGKVYAVEPIPLFGEIWKKNVQPHKHPQVELLPYALGDSEQTVRMGIPCVNGRLHHGMTKITDSAPDSYVHYFDVTMQNPDVLFAHLQELHFIKCDVEGYESIVFSNMKQILSKFRPLVQTELSGIENRKKVIDLFLKLGYTCSVLHGCKLVGISQQEAEQSSSDIYFLPSE